METTLEKPIIEAFKLYRDTVLKTNVDLHFWQWFIKENVKGFMADQSKHEKVYSAIFAACNINADANYGLLSTTNKSITLYKSSLEEHRQDFLNWVMNFSIVKIYNALELFLYQSIRIKYFPHLMGLQNNKRVINEVNKGIRKVLVQKGINYETNNNKHLIEYIKCQSEQYNLFTNSFLSINHNTTWEKFFILMSILRNIIVHEGMIISRDNENQIKSINKEIFNQYFIINNNLSGNNELSPKEDDFQNFIRITNDFALNTMKFMFEETNFDFMGMLHDS